MFDTLCSGNKTNAPNQLHAGLVLLSDVQSLHNALVGEVHFLPFSQLFSELFRLMSSDTYSRCSVCHLCMFRAFYSKILQHLEGRRAGSETGNLCSVGFVEIKNPTGLLWEFYTYTFLYFNYYKALLHIDKKKSHLRQEPIQLCHGKSA